MTLLAGDLTTPARAAIWLPSQDSTATILPMLISSMTNVIYNKLNRSRLYNQTFVRTFDGVGNYQLVLPDYPVTAISKVQLGSRLISAYPLPDPTTGVISNNTFGYGYRYVPWSGNMPGDPAILEFVNGTWCSGVQNIQVTYNAGYMISKESQTIPTTSPYNVTVLQPQGIWCRDNGVTYSDGTALTPVTASPATGQYIPPTDTTLGEYQFSSGDAGKVVLISYSFIPSDLELACIQLIGESNAYRTRIGEIDKSLGGQETIRYMRGGMRSQMFPELPPEVEAMIWPYVSVAPPVIGAPV